MCTQLFLGPSAQVQQVFSPEALSSRTLLHLPCLPPVSTREQTEGPQLPERGGPASLSCPLCLTLSSFTLSLSGSFSLRVLEAIRIEVSIDFKAKSISRHNEGSLHSDKMITLSFSLGCCLVWLAIHITITIVSERSSKLF